MQWSEWKVKHWHLDGAFVGYRIVRTGPDDLVQVLKSYPFAENPGVLPERLYHDACTRARRENGALVLSLRLPERYEVIAYSRLDSEDGYVLCSIPDNATPYASWRVNVASGICTDGDYYHCKTAQAAHHLFQERLVGRRSLADPIVKNAWTVLLLKPDFERDECSHESEWVLRVHVKGDTKDEAIQNAKQKAILELHTDPDDESDLAVLAVYAGHHLDQDAPL